MGLSHSFPPLGVKSGYGLTRATAIVRPVVLGFYTVIVH